MPLCQRVINCEMGFEINVNGVKIMSIFDRCDLIAVSQSELARKL